MSRNRPEYPDFAEGYNNGVHAIYIVNPRILEMDDLKKRGKPFLFCVGWLPLERVPWHDIKIDPENYLRMASEREHYRRHYGDALIDRLIGEKHDIIRPFVGKGPELDELLEGRLLKGQGRYVSHSQMPRPAPMKPIPEEFDVNGQPVRLEDLRSGYVPFSFGVGMVSDVVDYLRSGGTSIRTDLQDFKRVLAAYDRRMEEEARKRTFGYRIRALFGAE